MTVVILAGGRGTRIASVHSEIPKPMIPLLGKPILQHQIEALRRQGCSHFILIIGYLGEKIKEYFQDGAQFGVHIEYVEEKEPLGTAGSLYYLKGRVREDFLLLCGDLIFDIDLCRFTAAHAGFGGLATLFTHPNSHPYDSGIVVADAEGKVTQWLHKEEPRQWYRNCVNAGLHLLSPKILDRFQEPKKTDLDRDVLQPLISAGELYAYRSPEYVKDMGTPDRLFSVEEDLIGGKPQARNLTHAQKAIFLDRDGTINRYVGFLKSPEEFELLSGVCQAVRKINESGYLAIVVTNQPVIARGEVSLEGLDEIHRKMETLLGREGAFLDAVYFCPHHPDRGFAGERPEYKIDCDCRKPKPGMLQRAARDFHIDLSASWMVGDGEQDVLCGKNAGCKTAHIGAPCGADANGADLLDCINQILSEKNGKTTT